jgi:hypothetical protein
MIERIRHVANAVEIAVELRSLSVAEIPAAGSFRTCVPEDGPQAARRITRGTVNSTRVGEVTRIIK